MDKDNSCAFFIHNQAPPLLLKPWCIFHSRTRNLFNGSIKTQLEVNVNSLKVLKKISPRHVLACAALSYPALAVTRVQGTESADDLYCLRHSRMSPSEIQGFHVPSFAKKTSKKPLYSPFVTLKPGNSSSSSNPCIWRRKRYNSHIYHQRGKARSFWNEMSSAPHYRSLTLPALTFSLVKSDSIPGWRTMWFCGHPRDSVLSLRGRGVIGEKT